MQEEWRDVVGFEGLYKVSSFGNIMSYKNRCSKQLKLSVTPANYVVVTLSKGGKHITKSVHRLVAETFIPNPDNLPCINHKDNNGSNNMMDNLEWCTYEYNNNYADRNEKLSKSRKGKGRRFGIDNPMYGKHHTDYSKQRISEKLKVSMLGENNPMYGKKHSDESKLKMSKAKEKESENGKNE